MSAKSDLNGSPIRTCKIGPADLAFASPFPWAMNSPMCDLEGMSPQSAMSFSLSSPPRQSGVSHLKFDLSPGREGIADLLSANFSPSIFSPDEHAFRATHRDRDRDSSYLSGSSLPLFADLVSPIPGKLDAGMEEDEGAHHALSNNNNRSSSHLDGAAELCGFLNTASHSSKKTPRKPSASLMSAQRKAANESDSKEKEKLSSTSRIVTLKPKRASKTLMLTPQTTLLPPVLSPDAEGRLAVSLDDRAAPISSASESEAAASVSSTERREKNAKQPAAATRTSCNCKKSKCLKLYCDCFAALKHCDPRVCNCVSCHNVEAHEETRAEAIRLTKERNALAFKTKISEQETHVTGCHCKNSHCLKKYCECFNGSALCGPNCKCQSCQNFAGSAELMKARENSPKIDSVLSKKRKESPTSVAWLNQHSPEATSTFSKHQLVVKEEKKSHYSLRGNRDKNMSTPSAPSSSQTKRESCVTVTQQSLPAPLPSSLASSSLCPSASLIPPSLSSSSSISSAPSSSSSSSSFPAATSSSILSLTSSAPAAPQSALSTGNTNKPNKKPRVRFAPPHHALTYPFFGPNLPEQPKRVALLVLDCLTNKEMFSMSLVNGIWCDATRDEALWEQDG